MIKFLREEVSPEVHWRIENLGTMTPEAKPAVEWLGRLGEVEPNPYAELTPAERITMVWRITLSAWAFTGKPFDESRLRRDVESVSRRGS